MELNLKFLSFPEKMPDARYATATDVEGEVDAYKGKYEPV